MERYAGALPARLREGVAFHRMCVIILDHKRFRGRFEVFNSTAHRLEGNRVLTLLGAA